MSSEISEKLSIINNELNTAFDNGFYFEWKLRKKLGDWDWFYCLSNKDLIIKSIKTDNNLFIFVL